MPTGLVWLLSAHMIGDGREIVRDGIISDADYNSRQVGVVCLFAYANGYQRRDAPDLRADRARRGAWAHRCQGDCGGVKDGGVRRRGEGGGW